MEKITTIKTVAARWTHDLLSRRYAVIFVSQGLGTCFIVNGELAPPVSVGFLRNVS